MVDIALLKKEIEEFEIPIVTIAKKCGVSRQTVNNWLNNPNLISASHARLLADALRITDTNKIMAIFFAPNVENTETKEG